MAMKKVQCCLCAGVLVVLFYAPDVYGSLHWCIVLTYQCSLSSKCMYIISCKFSGP